MAMQANPYEPPIADCIAPQAASSEIRRPAFGTFLIGLWLLEGSVKVYLVFRILILGFNPIPFIVQDYHQSSLWVFFLISSFMIIETIGPWIGIYYLTGRRARTIPFEKALYRTLKTAGAIAIVTTLALMLYCQFAGR